MLIQIKIKFLLNFSLILQKNNISLFKNTNNNDFFSKETLYNYKNNSNKNCKINDKSLLYLKIKTKRCYISIKMILLDRAIVLKKFLTKFYLFTKYKKLFINF